MTFDILPTDLSKPDEGVRQGALHHGGEADVASEHNLIHGFYLKPVAVAVTVGSVDALKVPGLRWAEGGLKSHTDCTKTHYRKSGASLLLNCASRRVN